MKRSLGALGGHFHGQKVKDREKKAGRQVRLSDMR